MVPPSFSLPQSLIIDSWNVYNSDLPEKLFHTGDIIKIDSQELGNCRLSWRKAVYSVYLSWNEQEGKLQGTVPIKNQLARLVVKDLVTIQISENQADKSWTGELTLARKVKGGDGNTGVFIAHQDPLPPPGEPEDEKGTSTAE